MDDKKTDNELMTEFASCSLAAYNVIVNRYKIQLLNYLSRGFKFSRDDGEELVQNTLIKVYENKFTYRPTFQFSTWIYTIARNLAINEKKRKRPLSIEDSADAQRMRSHEPDASVLIEKTERKQLLLQALANLPEAQREVLSLRYLQELSFNEIEKITGKNLNTLKSLAKRGLEQMEDKLKEVGIENS